MAADGRRDRAGADDTDDTDAGVAAAVDVSLRGDAAEKSLETRTAAVTAQVRARYAGRPDDIVREALRRELDRQGLDGWRADTQDLGPAPEVTS